MDPEELELAGGRVFSAEELERLAGLVPLPVPLARALEELPLAGLHLVVADDLDPSGQGVQLLWMDAAQMERKATRDQLGMAAVKAGYIPIGICLASTGNPYFYRVDDGAIVRVPSDAGHGENLDEREIEVVARSLEKLLEAAEAEV